MSIERLKRALPLIQRISQVVVLGGSLAIYTHVPSIESPWARVLVCVWLVYLNRDLLPEVRP